MTGGRNEQLAVAAHVLALLARWTTPPGSSRLTSEAMAASIRTNPAHLRAVLAHLRRAGLVRSTRGPGGGWTLSRSPLQITLGDAWRALPSSGAALPSTRPAVSAGSVGRSVEAHLDRIGRWVISAVETELDRTTIADLLPADGP